MSDSRPQETISPAVAAVIGGITDDALRLHVDILVARAVGAMTATRRIDFAGFEERELQDGSLDLWNEVAPVFGGVFKELHALMDAAMELFPRPAAPAAAPAGVPGEDLDAAFDLLASGGADSQELRLVEATRTQAERAGELVHSYAWAIKRSIQDEARKLREPSLMAAQWNLLGELEEFRDRTLAALQGMVAAVLGVFDDVELEAIFPSAAEMVELGVTLRAELGALSHALEPVVARVKAGADADTLRALLAEAAVATQKVLRMPSLRYLRAAHRRELVRFHRAALAPSVTARGARELVDGFATYVASLVSVDLKQRLADHDREVTGEAVGSLRRCRELSATDPAQAMLFLAHAMRRVARLRGVLPELDAVHGELAALSSRGASPAALGSVLQRMEAALAPLATG